MTTRVILRADAAPSIGAGHLMRSLALGRALVAAGAHVMVATRTEDHGLLSYLERADLGIARVRAGNASDDAAYTAALARDATVVIDGYQFDEAYVAALQSRGCRTVIIDDMPRLESYDADILLDQNPGALRQPYRAPSSRLLLGPRFMLLRPEFPAAQRHRVDAPGRPRILVTLGASDAANVTPRVLQALDAIPHVDATIVLGAVNERADGILEEFGRTPRFRFVRNAVDLPQIMAETDVAIAGVGVTLWELASLGVPTLAISSTDVQRPIAAVAHEYGGHRWIGDASELDAARIGTALQDLLEDSAGRAEMARLGRALVDGRGAERVARAITATASPDWIIRPVADGDAEPIWEIASDPTVRQMAFDGASFTFAQHERWLGRRLASGDTRFWVAEREGTVGGFVRYDRVGGDRADIDVGVAAAARGRGLGTRLLTDTWTDACALLGVSSVRGVVFSENEASRRAFAKADFALVASEEIKGRLCSVYEHSVSERVNASS